MRLLLALAFALGFATAPALAHQHEEESCEHGRPITMEQLPGPVKEALQARAQGKEIEELCQQTRNGSTVFSAEVVSGDTGTDLVFDRNGKLLNQGSHSESAEPENGDD